MKKNNLRRSKGFKADMQTIKKEDVRKLQETYSKFFGANSDEIKKHSLRLRNKVYLFGFVATIFFALIFYLAKNLRFVGM